VSPMEVNGHLLPERTLGHLRLLLGGERVDEILEIVAALLNTEARSVEERICFAELPNTSGCFQRWSRWARQCGATETIRPDPKVGLQALPYTVTARATRGPKLPR
jgi:hypothetical protein